MLTEAPQERSAASLDEVYIHSTGFREYDARWFMDRDINLRGLQQVGQAFGVLLRRMDPSHHEVILGHDYRAYSQAAAQAVALGLISAGMGVVDIGLAATPMAYFAQYHLGIRALAQITASHNENGWTGIKMGHDLSRTLGPQEMLALKEIALSGELPSVGGGSLHRVHGIREAWLQDLCAGGPLRASPRVVLATGNGTGGYFAPQALTGIGCELIHLHTDLDWRFPNGNPNPESESFLAQLRERVLSERSRGPTIGLGLDGDADRLGVVDELGRAVYSDKIGLLLARWLAPQVPDPLFVVDVKSTSLLDDQRVLPARVHWERTGHSYIKRAVQDLKATAGFERSGHFFFGPPFGRGYDDGLLSAILLLRMLDTLDRPLSELLDELPPTFQSPNYQPLVADTLKYGVVEQVERLLTGMLRDGGSLAGVPIDRLVTINGVKAICADGSWLLVRASSNRPSLVVMAESLGVEARVGELIEAARVLLGTIPGVAPLDPSTAH